MLVPRWSTLLLVLMLVAGACGQDPGELQSGTTVQGAISTASGESTQPDVALSGSITEVDTASGVDPSSTVSSSTTGPSTTVPSTTASSITASSTVPSSSVGPPITIRLRLDRRVDDDATAGFASFARSVLTDGRGWTRAGFVFTFDEADADYTVVLAEGSEVDSLCLPYDTYGSYSCQIGPVVALNADRWRTAVDNWPASLDDYRTMLVNHEVGHLLGQHHPASRCPGDGQLAPVMAQQSSGVEPCIANPWPLPWEITCAQQRVEPLAPPFERDIVLTCGPDGSTG